ncbi:MAG: SusD/RagB family nutrient-binding outer membrane lipoprotein [Bacteroidia bacterium]
MTKIGLLSLGLLLMLLTSCEKFLDVNADPNNPTEVTPPLLLTSAESYLAYTMGGDVNRYAGLFVQHLAGVQGQAQEEYDIYLFNDDETNNFWRFGMYAGALGDLDLLIKDTETTGSPHYSGISKILMAYGIGVMADLFGQVPYSEAFQYEQNLTPAFDNQQDIYNTVQALLDDGINDLNAESSILVPGSDDIIFNGDIDAWKRFAAFLKAKYLNHLSIQDASGSAQKILDLLDNSDAFANSADNATYVFLSSPNATNPLFQFEQQRGQIAVSKTILDDIMIPLNDPRIPLYADPIAAGGYAGAPNGTTIQDQPHLVFSGVGPFHESANSAVILGSYFEQKFIEAEAAMRASNQERAHTAYLAAINASFGFLGIADSVADYIAQAEVDPGMADLTMEHIMTQKYIAMFTQGAESWTDWRRTGIPALTASLGNLTSGVIPVRFPYPESELTLNSSNVPDVTFLSPTWFQDGTED